jgi:hypothetical protein
VPSRCRTVLDAAGRPVAIACSREPHRRCSVPGCSNHADKQCDFPVKRDGRAATCDRYICGRCAVSVGKNLDNCPPHARASQIDKAP